MKKFKASDTEESLKKAYESAVPSQDEQVIQEGLARVYGKVCEVEDTQPSGEWRTKVGELYAGTYVNCSQWIEFIEGLLLTQRSKLVESIQETNFWKTCEDYFTPEQREYFLAHLKSNLK